MTFTPLVLVAGLIEPPAGVSVQLTPAASLVVAETGSVWLIASAARAGAIDTLMAPAELMVSNSVVDCDCAGLLESVTLKVSGVPEAVAVGVPVIAPAMRPPSPVKSP